MKKCYAPKTCVAFLFFRCLFFLLSSQANDGNDSDKDNANDYEVGQQGEDNALSVADAV